MKIERVEKEAETYLFQNKGLLKSLASRLYVLLLSVPLYVTSVKASGIGVSNGTIKVDPNSTYESEPIFIEGDVIEGPQKYINILDTIEFFTCLTLLLLTLIASIFSGIKLMLVNKAFKNDKENQELDKKAKKWKTATIITFTIFAMLIALCLTRGYL